MPFARPVILLLFCTSLYFCLFSQGYAFNFKALQGRHANLGSGLSVYIIECRGGKYYVGSTERSVEERIKEHVVGDGSDWTRMFRPIRVVEIKKDAHRLDEDNMTKQYMLKYGIHNVRGGSYANINLSAEQEAILQREICTAENRCFRCNGYGHLQSNCPNVKSTNDVTGDDRDGEQHRRKGRTGTVTTGYQRSGGTSYSSVNACYRCGREGHFVSDCFASRHINGRVIVDVDEDEDEMVGEYQRSAYSSVNACYRCGREGHFASDCFASRHINGRVIVDVDEDEDEMEGEYQRSGGPSYSSVNACYRCGRDSHLANECFASKHINGRMLPRR